MHVMWIQKRAGFPEQARLGPARRREPFGPGKHLAGREQETHDGQEEDEHDGAHHVYGCRLVLTECLLDERAPGRLGSAAAGRRAREETRPRRGEEDDPEDRDAGDHAGPEIQVLNSPAMYVASRKPMTHKPPTKMSCIDVW